MSTDALKAAEERQRLEAQSRAKTQSIAMLRSQSKLLDMANTNLKQVLQSEK